MTYAEDMAASAALLNDQQRQTFTDAVLLAYLNIARNELQEIFELNNIPVTKETSAVITVPAGTTVIEIEPDPIVIIGTPYYPPDLIEIERLWESPTGQNSWYPVTKRDYLIQSEINNLVSVFGEWAWMDQEIRILASGAIIDLKIDYIKSLFLPLAIGDIAESNIILNTDTFLQYRVAGLASEFIDENGARAQALNSYGLMALDRSLGISTKGRQSIVTRRRPFRSSYKNRSILTS
jgi:hypothetical protein